MTTQQAVEKTKERIDKILKVYGGWVHLGNVSQSKQVALEQLLSLIDEEKHIAVDMDRYGGSCKDVDCPLLKVSNKK